MGTKYTDSKPSRYVNSDTWDALQRKQNEEAKARAEELKKQALTAGNYTGEFADILKKASEGLADSIYNFNSTNPNLSTERPDGLPTFIPDLAKSSPAGLDKLMLTAENDRKRMLEEAAKANEETKRTADNDPMQNLMQPSQEFQQQMKGREVALRRSSGDLLGAQAAMQDPNYVLGSGSALRQKSQPIAPEWTKMNRAARRLRRQGYEQQAGQMASLAEMERLGTPNITTQEQRNRMNYMDMERDMKSDEQRRQANLYDLYLRKRYQQEINSMV